MKNNLRPFHLAIPITDINTAYDFYVKVLGCKVGRRSREWIDFNFFGHQLVGHLVLTSDNKVPTNSVDGEDVPSRHFGLVMDKYSWDRLVEKLAEHSIKFLIKPQTRFKGKEGEQSTFFIQDPFLNALEFKAFKNDSQIFSKG